MTLYWGQDSGLTGEHPSILRGIINKHTAETLPEHNV